MSAIFAPIIDRRDKKRSRSRAQNPKVRMAIFERADSKCEICAFKFAPILHVHHIVPVSRGGRAKQSNLVLLCPNCHALAHRYLGKIFNPRWIDGLASAGLNARQARRLLLVASTRARVAPDDEIVAYDAPEGIK